MPHPLLPDLETLASSVAAAQGFELCGIQLLTHMSPMTLEVQIRHSSGADVSLDDCAGFSGVLGDALEASTLLTEAYVLEISSPGIGDQLIEDRDFQTFRGFPVEVLTATRTTPNSAWMVCCSSAAMTSSRSTSAAGSNGSPAIG